MSEVYAPFARAMVVAALLAAITTLPSDNLDEQLTRGDLSLQACADDPQVAYHAVRDLARIARGTATVRWTVLGFGRASAGPAQSTPRNLMGFKDGTRNVSADEEFSRFVWVDDPGDGADWMRGGTYQVVRKIRMNLETWDADNVSDQQRTSALAIDSVVTEASYMVGPILGVVAATYMPTTWALLVCQAASVAAAA